MLGVEANRVLNILEEIKKQTRSEASVVHPDLLTNMAAIGNYCFWLVDF
jgi:hypothetical protein